MRRMNLSSNEGSTTPLKAIREQEDCLYKDQNIGTCVPHHPNQESLAARMEDVNIGVAKKDLIVYTTRRRALWLLVAYRERSL